MILLLAAPYSFAGIAISLALTRSPYPVGTVYAADLAGAATGCLGVLLLLRFVDAPSAILVAAAGAAFAAGLFKAAGKEPAADANSPARASRGAWLLRPLPVFVALVTVAILNGLTAHGLQPIIVKNTVEQRTGSQVHEDWNSFSRVLVVDGGTAPPLMWGPSDQLPADVTIDQFKMNIDGDTWTNMYAFSGDFSDVEFLKYDITNLAYYIRDSGRSAVIGVGGGRDVLAALLFGMRDVTGVELNPIFIELLTERQPFADFAGLADLDGVRLHADEARSWFARSGDAFDLIQMSLADSFAATGAGAFTLSENGLYTLEGWQTIINRLAPDGVFTVSRWYGPGAVDETGRLISLAAATLLESGAVDPGGHIFLASTPRLATLILSLQPLSEADLDTLHAVSDELGYMVLASPRRPAADPVLETILEARSVDDLKDRVSAYALDLTPPIDDRPFFFNQLRLDRPDTWSMVIKGKPQGVGGGNLLATGTLLIILLGSVGAVVATIALPLLPSVRNVDPKLAYGGTTYFLALGLGFMLVEIGLLQRFSVFLGHPIYSLSLVLFGLILSTGIGSYLSERLALPNWRWFAMWVGLLGLYIFGLSLWLPSATAAAAGAGIVVRGGVTLLAIVPAGLLMGFGFPTGMRLVKGLDPRPLPWFWGINGAAGVLGSGLAVAISIAFGISATLSLGALSYLALIPSGLVLFGMSAYPLRSRTEQPAADRGLAEPAGTSH
jgi:hypothetical protein